MANHNKDGRGIIKTPRTLRANVKTSKVDKNRPGKKNRELFLAGTEKKQTASSVGETKADTRGRNGKKKKKTADEHPLAKAFTDSLSQTTSHFSTKLPRNLSDKLQIALSRITATTTRSRRYLSTSLELKSKLFTSSPLLSVRFREEVVRFRELVREKGELLDELWLRWEECVREIEGLSKDEGVLKLKDNSNSSHLDNQSEYLEETKDDDEFDLLVGKIKSVGRIWTKKMEDSEKKIADEVLQQQKLAATVLL